MKRFINNQPFVGAVRTLGWLYLGAMFVNTIFFYNQFLYQTFLSSGLFGAVAGVLINYKIDWKAKPLTTRILFICLDMIIFSFISWRLIHYK